MLAVTGKKRMGLLLAGALVMGLLAGCLPQKEPENPLAPKTEEENLGQTFAAEDEERQEKELEKLNQQADFAGPRSWEEARGIFYGENYSETQLPRLAVQYLDQGWLGFSLYDSAEGGELALSGVARVEGNKAYYEDVNADPEEEVFHLTLTLERGTVSLTLSGALPFPAEGQYRFERDEAGDPHPILTAMLKTLAEDGAAGGALIAKELKEDWFYEAETRTARYYIARDFTSIYRLEQPAPKLLWGSSKTMLQDKQGEDGALVRHVMVLSKDAVIPVGGKTQARVNVAGGLAYTIQYASPDESLATVTPEGEVTGISPGVATITGTIRIDGEEKEFTFAVLVEAKDE